MTRIITLIGATIVIGGVMFFLFGGLTTNEEGITTDETGYVEEMNQSMIENSQKRRHKY